MFKQCTRCGNWVCEPVCWNKKAGLCETARRISTRRSPRPRRRPRGNRRRQGAQVDYLGQRDLAQVAAAVCPQCGAKTQGGKFCPECGATHRRQAKCAAAAAPRRTDRRSSARSAASRTGAERDDEPRRAPAAFELTDGRALRAQGEAEALIGDDALRSARSPSRGWMPTAERRRLPHRNRLLARGPTRAPQLGRRFDTFAAELRRSARQARVAGLLAHGIACPTVFEGAVLESGTVRPRRARSTTTHVTVVPADGDPWQLPLRALNAVERQDEPPAVVLQAGMASGPAVGRLARKRDEFYRAVTEQRDAQAELLDAFTGSRSFADGLGVARGQVADFDGHGQALERTGPGGGRAALIALARGAEPRLGLVQLLDPDAVSTGSADRAPGSLGVLPAGAGRKSHRTRDPGRAGAATYVFEAPIDAVNQDLQALHFRRHALALQGSAAELTPQNPSRLALRKLEPLIRLRHAIRARIIHNEGWREGVRVALEAGEG